MSRRPRLLATARVGALALAVAWLAGPALAHGGSLGGAARESLSVPPWLVTGTGGAVVGASVLVASFATDRQFVASLHAPLGQFSIPGERLLVAGTRALGLVGLAGVVVVGLFGPGDPLSNGAVVVVWAGWWAGFAMSTYLVGNAWPALNPWRTLARPLEGIGRTYPWRWAGWPSVAGLLGLVWLEVVSPLADRPPVLATVVLAYTAVTVAGAVVYGTDAWFETVDPISRVFRFYGAVAPVGRDADGSMVVRPPGSGLTDDRLAGADDVAFVVALLWATTFDGLVTTPLWGRFAVSAVTFGVPAVVLYPLALVTGFTAAWGLYLLAARIARRTAPTYLSAATIGRRFGPSLLAIAAGYHLAHFLDYFLSLVPALVLAVTAPFATVDPGILVVPGWFGVVAVASVLGGHVLAVLVAHATAFELFPDRLQAVRSQYPVAAAMVAYTMVSLWVVTRPEQTPPFVGV